MQESNQPSSFSELIDRLGVKLIAAAIKKSSNTVRMMKTRNNIKSDYWSDLIYLARQKGMTYVDANFLLGLTKNDRDRDAA